jgi:2-polyprenyl-3-methyl-5-hydroxy-6-metoxy-1,4-benzoquinol methylase
MATLQFTEEQARRLEAMYSTADVREQRAETLRLLVLSPDETVIDVGSGPGFLCESMADLVGGRGRVLGIDVSSDLIELAQRRNRRGWLQYEQGDAVALAAPDQSFDVAVSAQVLEYVADVDGVLRQIHRVLKPGGRALIVDTEWASVVWHSTEPARMAKVLAVWEAHCTNSRLPRTLMPRLRAAGFAVEEVSGFPIINTTLAEENYGSGLLGLIVDFIRKQGSMPPEELDAWRAELTTLSEKGEYFFSTMRYMFRARKPGE